MAEKGGHWVKSAGGGMSFVAASGAGSSLPQVQRGSVPTDSQAKQAQGWMADRLADKAASGLGVSKAKVMNLARRFQRAGMADVVSAVGSAAQMIQAGGMANFRKGFRPDSEMMGYLNKMAGGR